MENPPSLPKSDPLPTLSILHYVLGGFCMLGVMFGVFYVFFAAALIKFISNAAVDGGGTINGREVAEMAPGERAEALAMVDMMGSLFTVIGLVTAAVSLVLAILLFLSGKKLGRAQGHRFCMVVAGISCFLFPFGTALGVMTLITLNKPEVKMRFG